jgi:hypothetical protein
MTEYFDQSGDKSDAGCLGINCDIAAAVQSVLGTKFARIERDDYNELYMFTSYSADSLASIEPAQYVIRDTVCVHGKELCTCKQIPPLWVGT